MTRGGMATFWLAVGLAALACAQAPPPQLDLGPPVAQPLPQAFLQRSRERLEQDVQALAERHAQDPTLGNAQRLVRQTVAELLDAALQSPPSPAAAHAAALLQAALPDLDARLAVAAGAGEGGRRALDTMVNLALAPPPPGADAAAVTHYLRSRFAPVLAWVGPFRLDAGNAAPLNPWTGEPLPPVRLRIAAADQLHKRAESVAFDPQVVVPLKESAAVTHLAARFPELAPNVTEAIADLTLLLDGVDLVTNDEWMSEPTRLLLVQVLRETAAAYADPLRRAGARAALPALADAMVLVREEPGEASEQAAGSARGTVEALVRARLGPGDELVRSAVMRWHQRLRALTPPAAPEARALRNPAVRALWTNVKRDLDAAYAAAAEEQRRLAAEPGRVALPQTQGALDLLAERRARLVAVESLAPWVERVSPMHAASPSAIAQRLFRAAGVAARPGGNEAMAEIQAFVAQCERYLLRDAGALWRGGAAPAVLPAATARQVEVAFEKRRAGWLAAWAGNADPAEAEAELGVLADLVQAASWARPTTATRRGWTVAPPVARWGHWAFAPPEAARLWDVVDQRVDAALAAGAAGELAGVTDELQAAHRDAAPLFALLAVAEPVLPWATASDEAHVSADVTLAKLLVSPSPGAYALAQRGELAEVGVLGRDLVVPQEARAPQVLQRFGQLAQKLERDLRGAAAAK